MSWLISSSPAVSLCCVAGSLVTVVIHTFYCYATFDCCSKQLCGSFIEVLASVRHLNVCHCWAAVGSGLCERTEAHNEVFTDGNETKQSPAKWICRHSAGTNVR